MKMKVTVRSGRFDKAGLHNDRQFDVNASDHIDPTKSGENRYWNYLGDGEHTFKEIELEFYKKEFGEYLEEKRQRRLREQHPERAKTPEQYWSARYSRPEDVILQIGDTYNHVSGEELWKCAEEYRDRFNAMYGDHCKILDMALHMDEATPHVHIRRVWIGHDDKGNPCVSQKKALYEMGIMGPKPEKDESRNNNAKMTFSRRDRKIFEMMCENHDIDIDKNHKKGVGHLEVNEYKAKEFQKSRKTISNVTMWMEEDMRNDQKFSAHHSEELTEIYSEKDPDHRSSLILNLYKKKLEDDIKIMHKAENVRRMVRYIKIKGLEDDFRKYVKSEKEKDNISL